MRTPALVLIAALAACGEGSGATDAGAPARQVSFSGVTFDASGRSEPLRVAVPEGARSVTVVVRGETDALYGLAWLETSDAIEHVALPSGVDLPGWMSAHYFDEQVGAMPGELYQSVRLGLFTHVYPNRPEDALPPGDLVLRVATSTPGAPVDVEVLMPEADGARTLALNVFAVSDSFAYGEDDPTSLPFLVGLESILAAGDVDVTVERVINLPGTGLSTMTELTEPQEPPTSMSSELALLAGGLVAGDALNVFVVDELPFGVGGWSLGTPGPPASDTYYSGVVARTTTSGELARVLAHEIAHYVGLSHVENVGVSGARYPDPLADTEPGTGNLMDGGGTALSQDQAFVLGRSALLRR